MPTPYKMRLKRNSHRLPAAQQGKQGAWIIAFLSRTLFKKMTRVTAINAKLEPNWTE